VRPFGELEARIMRCLWQRGEPMTVREVLTELNGGRTWAYTSVMTVMDNLHRKGQLRREKQGQAWRYTPTRTQAEHTAALLAEVLAEGGQREEALLHFVADLDEQSVEQLRAAVDAARRRGGAA
jgi:predicted transcriptional regulator